MDSWALLLEAVHDAICTGLRVRLQGFGFEGQGCETEVKRAQSEVVAGRGKGSKCRPDPPAKGS